MTEEPEEKQNERGRKNCEREFAPNNSKTKTRIN
jgi:hypothetical protein